MLPQENSEVPMEEVRLPLENLSRPKINSISRLKIYISSLEI